MAFAFAQPQAASAYEIDSGMSDSDASSSSPGTVRRRCFCGREVEVVEGEAKIYCSISEWMGPSLLSALAFSSFWGTFHTRHPPR
jgi:hypothetical protein